MARPPLDYQSQIYSDDQRATYAYQGMLRGSIPVTIKEQLYPSLATANSAIQESMRLCALSHSAVSKIYDCYLDREEDGRYKAVTVLEALTGGIEGLEWKEWNLLALLRTLVAALSTAERQGIALQSISPSALLLTSAGVKLFPSFGWADPAYLSPERLQSQSPYDPFKSDVYSLALTVLSLAWGQDRNRVETVRTDPRVLEGLGRLGQLLGWMLRGVEDRPGFGQLEEYFQSLAPCVEPTAILVEDRQREEADPVIEREKTHIIEPTPVQAAETPAAPKPKQRPNPQASIPKEECKAAKPVTPASRNCPVCFTPFIPNKKHPNSEYCSKTCREKKALRVLSPPAKDQPAPAQCAYCPASLNGAEKRDLSCGHSFHSLDCLFTFMLAKTGNFANDANYFCPKCNKRIKYGKEIEGAFGKSALQRRVEEAKKALLCSKCQEAPMYCELRGKLLCKFCSDVD